MDTTVTTCTMLRTSYISIMKGGVGGKKIVWVDERGEVGKVKGTLGGKEQVGMINLTKCPICCAQVAISHS